MISLTLYSIKALVIESCEEVGGTIEIGLLHDHSTKIQVELLHASTTFRKQYPAVTFSLFYGTSAEIEQKLIEQQLDIGFLINFSERHRFDVFHIAKEEHLIVTSPAYLKKRGPIKKVKDVYESDLIDIDKSLTCFTPWLQKHGQKVEEKSPIVSVSDFHMVREFALKGLGIAVIPKYLVEDDLKKQRLLQVLPKLSTLKAVVDCATIKGERERACESLFLKESLTRR